MVRHTAIILGLVLSIVGSVLGDAKPGGIARQISLGGSQAGSQLILNPFVMEDPALMLLNPAYQSMYRDYGWMNIGGGTLNGLSSSDNGYGNQNAGVNFALSDEWGLGAVLSHDPSGVNAIILGLNTLGARIPPVQNMWEIVASHQSGSLTLGFGFMYGRSNSDSTSSTVTPPTSGSAERKANVLGFRAGLIYDMGSGDALDMSATLHLDNAESKGSFTGGATTVSSSIKATAAEVGFAARWKHKINQKWSVIPVGALAFASTKPDTNGTSNGMKISALAYSIGIGGEYRTADFYLAGGLSYQSAQVKAEIGPDTNKSTTTFRLTSIPTINVGGEWWFTSWLAGRAGYYRSMASFKNKFESKNANSETNLTIPNSFIFIGGLSPSNNDGLITLGLGFKFGNFSLDATVSEEALRRGLGLIGASDNINTFGYITSSYNFGD